MPRSVPSLSPCEPRQRIASCSFMLVSCRPCAHMTRGDTGRTGRSDHDVAGRDNGQRASHQHQPRSPGANSDCVLEPVFVCPDPIRNGDSVLVLCDVLLPDGTPHPTNTRAACAAAAEEYADQEPSEQEYTFMQNGRPLGWPEVGYPAPQGPYYCGVGGGKMVGRDII